MEEKWDWEGRCAGFQGIEDLTFRVGESDDQCYLCLPLLLDLHPPPVPRRRLDVMPPRAFLGKAGLFFNDL